MTITIDSVITVRQPDAELLAWCNDNLVMDNPAYYKLLRMGKRVWNIPQKIVCYKYYNGELILPRGCLKAVWDMFPDLSLYCHRMTKCQPAAFRSQIVLRDYQQPAVQAVKKHKQGIIVMPCGAGKTETALQVIAELGQPALWITHTTDLLNQSLNRAREKLLLKPGEYGVIGGGEYTIGTHITFATVQSLRYKDLDSLAWRFGAVVIDECHRAFMSDSRMGMFEEVMERLPALYRIGVTASEHRSDGLIRGMYHLIGPKIYEVGQAQLNQGGNLVLPNVRVISTGYHYNGDKTLEFGAMLCDMVSDPARNQQIRTSINENSDRCCLVLSDRLEQLEWLYQVTSDHFAHREYINGKSGRKNREDAIRRMREGDSNLLFATYSLAKEGLDIPNLDRLFLCTPHRDQVAVQQSVGRIMRRHPQKEDAVVYDFVDQEGLCISQYKSRKAVYRKLGCRIDESGFSEYRIKMKGAVAQ